MNKYLGITTPATANVIGLFNYRRASGTHRLLRMLPTKIEKLLAGAFVDVTGVALNGTISTRPQYDIIDDILVFTNEGADRPRKFDDTGNAITLGGTPPFAKALKTYLGFLFLINISDNGTFTDVFDSARTARYSDDFDVEWSPCQANTLTLDETPGAWVAADVLGRDMFGIKTDGVVKVTFIGGERRFSQELMRESVGCLAPLSVVKVLEAGIVYLGIDGLLYLITGSSITPLSSFQLAKTLPPRLNSNRLQFSRGVVNAKEDTYYLLYDSTGLTGSQLDAYVSYNFRTKQFAKGKVGRNVTSVAMFKASEGVQDDVLAGVTAPGNFVDTFDDSSATNDDGVGVNRFWTSGPISLHETGWFHGVRVVFERSAGATVTVDISTNLNSEFHFPQSFDLRGNSPADEHVELEYYLPPQWCEWVNVRLRMIHTSPNGKTILERLGIEITPKLPTGEARSASSGVREIRGSVNPY